MAVNGTHEPDSPITERDMDVFTLNGDLANAVDILRDERRRKNFTVKRQTFSAAVL